MANVEIYTKMTCGYCMMAKRLLSRKEVSFTEIPVGGGNREKLEEMMKRSNGGRTVPRYECAGPSRKTRSAVGGVMMRAAVVQMTATADVAHNIERVSTLIRQAADDGATFIQTPEVTNMIPPTGDELFRLIGDEDDDEMLAALRALTAELGVTLHIGSLALKSEDPERAANRGFLVGPDGDIIARYDKVHMFEADLGEKGKYREAARYRPGDKAVLADIAGAKVGMAICYDMRFPSMFRHLAQSGATILTAPSAFTVPTGKAHWHTLLRARAIENGCFMLAAAQWGKHGGKDESAMRETYGHSLIVDPWGAVLADAGEGEGVAVADLDFDLVTKARKRIGSLTQGLSVPVVTY